MLKLALAALSFSAGAHLSSSLLPSRAATDEPRLPQVLAIPPPVAVHDFRPVVRALKALAPAADVYLARRQSTSDALSGLEGLLEKAAGDMNGGQCASECSDWVEEIYVRRPFPSSAPSTVLTCPSFLAAFGRYRTAQTLRRTRRSGSAPAGPTRPPRCARAAAVRGLVSLVLFLEFAALTLCASLCRLRRL